MCGGDELYEGMGEDWSLLDEEGGPDEDAADDGIEGGAPCDGWSLH